jgi:hypothetical protein
MPGRSPIGQNKTLLLGMGAVVLVLIAGVVFYKTILQEPSGTSNAYEKIPPAQRDQMAIEAERERRKHGKPAFLHLPEDPPGFPATAK